MADESKYRVDGKKPLSKIMCCVSTLAQLFYLSLFYIVTCSSLKAEERLPGKIEFMYVARLKQTNKQKTTIHIQMNTLIVWVWPEFSFITCHLSPVIAASLRTTADCVFFCQLW